MTKEKFSKVKLIEQPGNYLICNDPKNTTHIDSQLRGTSLNLNGEDIFKYLLMENRETSARIIIHQKTEGPFKKTTVPARLELRNPNKLTLDNLCFGVCLTTQDDKNYFIYYGAGDDCGSLQYEFGIQEVEDVEIKGNCMRPISDGNIHSSLYMNKLILETESKEIFWTAEINCNYRGQLKNLIKTGLKYLNSAIADLKIPVWKKIKD